MATILSAAAVRREPPLAPAQAHAPFASLAVGYGGLVSLGWWHTGSRSAVLLGVGAALGLALGVLGTLLLRRRKA